MSLEKVALIDIGSNSMRLEIVSIRGDDFWTVARYKSSARIASGMYPDLVITREAVQRASLALGTFSRWIAFHQADTVRCVATSAVRDASNREEVLATLSEALGGPIEVLEGDREGWYSFFGVQNGFDEPEALIFDIGGGSAELIDVHRGRPRKILTLPLGAVRLSEMFFTKGSRPTAAEWKKMEGFIQRTLEESGLFDTPFPALIGVGGTARQLARISQKIRKYPFHPDIHHYEIPTKDLPKILKRLGRHIGTIQAKNFSIGPDRADILPAGLAVVSSIASLSRSRSLTFSHYGLRQGLFMEHYLKGTERSDEPVGLATIRRVARRFGRYRDSRPLRQTLQKLLATLLPTRLPPRRIALLSDAIGAFAFLPVFYNPVPNNRELWDLLLHGELPGLSQKDRLLAGLVLTLREDGTGRPKKRTHPYLRHLNNEETRVLGVLMSATTLSVEIVSFAAGGVATLSYRAPVLQITQPETEDATTHLALVKTEERDLGLGYPLSIQWFAGKPSRETPEH